MAAEEIQDPRLRTLAEVANDMDLAKIFTKPWHDNVKKWRRLYDFDHYSNKALPYEERYEDPTPTNIVDLAVGIVLANDVEWTVKGWEPEIDEEDDSSDVEKFLAGLLYVNGERHQYHIPYESTLSAVRDGAAVLYSVWDPVLAQKYKSSVLDEETGERKTIYTNAPIRVQVLDALQIFLVPGGPGRWSRVIRQWEMSAADVETTYAVRLKNYVDMSQKDRQQANVTMRDYWRVVSIKVGDNAVQHRVENALLAGDEVIRPMRTMNGYEDLPFDIGFFKPVLKDNPAGWHGILRPIETTITHVEKAVNRRNRQILVYSALPFVAKGIPQRKFNLDPALGNIVTLSREETLEFPAWPGNAPDVQMHIDYLRARLQQAGFTDVMFGSGASQVSGYALSQMGDQNRIRLEQPVKHLEMMWSLWSRKCLRLAKSFTAEGGEIRVYGNMRGLDFVSRLKVVGLDNYMVKASIQPEFPNERVRNHAMAAQVKGILSEHTLMENYLDIKQPDDERKRKMIEQAMMHPLMQQFAIMKLLVQAANSKDKIIAGAAALVIQNMNQQQAPPQVGPVQPGATPPGAPNALGTPSATGQETPQAGGQAPPGEDFATMLESMAGGQGGMTGTGLTGG